jgi:hypothetical protein
MELDIADTVRRAVGGDADAVEVLARRALTLALRTSAATLISREDAADVAQEVAIEVLRGLRSLRDPSLRALNLMPPAPTAAKVHPIPPPAGIERRDRLGGLIHEYRVAA